MMILHNITAIVVILSNLVCVMNAEDIAKAVRYCRKKRGLSQHQLAILAGVGKTVVFDIEKGKQTVKLLTLLKVLDVLLIKLKLFIPFESK